MAYRAHRDCNEVKKRSSLSPTRTDDVPPGAEPPDTSLEHELREILEGDDWGIVWKDFPRLAHRVEVEEAISQRAGNGSLVTDSQSPNSTAITQSGSCQPAALRTLVAMAERLEPPTTVAALQNEIANNPDYAGDHIVIKHLVEDLLTTSSPTARLMRALNQCIVLTGAWYLHQNLLGPAGLMAKDVRGPEGWTIIIRFCEAVEGPPIDATQDDPIYPTIEDTTPTATTPINTTAHRAIYITHNRRESSLDGAAERFELDWAVHLAFDERAQFQSAMLKVKRFHVADGTVGHIRWRELMGRFCGNEGLVIEQEVVGGASSDSGQRPVGKSGGGGRILRGNSKRGRNKVFPSWLKKPLRRRKSGRGDKEAGSAVQRGISVV